MGLLSDQGQTYSFQQSEQFIEKIRQFGYHQLMNIFEIYHGYTINHLIKKITNNQDAAPSNKIFWGQEIQTNIVKIDDEAKTIQIQPTIYDFVVKNSDEIQKQFDFQLLPQFGSWMIETTPRFPYQSLFNFESLIYSIRTRSQQLRTLLAGDERVLNIPNFPMLGNPDYAFHENFKDRKGSFQIQGKEEEELKEGDGIGSSKNYLNLTSDSLFMDDRLVNKHPRFPTLMLNIKERRGSKVEIRIPLFQDIQTDMETQNKYEPFPGEIYMDSMHFGMGCCSLQTTFSGQNYDNTRWIYDQMAVLTPIFLALTAGSAIFKGKLADIDTRWQVIEQSVDCRTQDERNPKSENYIYKSRYSSISYYISDDKRNLDMYNDSGFKINQRVKKEITETAKDRFKSIQRRKKRIVSCSQRFSSDSVEEILPFENEIETTTAEEQIQNNEQNETKFEMVDMLDEKMLNHIAFLFTRDPLVIFKDQTGECSEETSHFENFQSTNWNNVRFKPPPSLNSEIGWRFQFRSMELQLTDDENIAFSMLSHVFVRLFYSEEISKLNLYIPISKLDENFRRAQKRNALLTEKFYFRTNIYDAGQPEIAELTINEILFGVQKQEDSPLQKHGDFIGLVNVLQNFLDECRKECKCKDACEELGSPHHLSTIKKTFEFLKKKCEGQYLTLASFVREFVRKHKDYNFDSIITPTIHYDLCQLLIDIHQGNIKHENFPVIYDDEYHNYLKNMMKEKNQKNSFSEKEKELQNSSEDGLIQAKA